MKIENYKGIDIYHNAEKDEFTTNLVVQTKSIGKSKEYLKAPRLQRMRNDIDKFLAVSTKKPVLKKAWLKSRHDDGGYELVEILLFNLISEEVMYKDKEGRITTIGKRRYSDDGQFFLSCKENDAIIKRYNEMERKIAAIRKSKGCSCERLLPLTTKHFN